MPGPDPALPVLVVGGKGRVGGMLRRYWATKVPEPGVVFQSRHGEDGTLAWDPNGDPGCLLEWVQSVGGCGTMVVLAGVTPGSDRPMAENAAIADKCLAAAAEAGIARVLYASSSAVYGAPRPAPFRESDPAHPANEYGTAKLAAEEVCARWRAHGVDVCALRIGNVAGADMLLRNAAKANAADPVLLDRFADGAGPRRSYIGTGALAHVIERLSMAERLPAVLNVGAPVPVAMEALLIASGAPWGFVPARDGAMQDIVLDCTALEMIVPFSDDDCDPVRLVDEARRWGGLP